MQLKLFTRPGKEGRVNIYLYATFEGQRLRCRTGESCAAKNWNAGKELVRSGEEGYLNINNELKRWQETAMAIYRKHGTLTREMLEEGLRENISAPEQEPTAPTVADRIDAYMEKWKHVKTWDTLRKYKGIAGHIRSFSPGLQPEGLTEEWLRRYLGYLLGKNMANTSIKKHLRAIREVLQESGLPSFWVKASLQSNTDPAYLLPEELEELEKWVPTSESLAHVRDCFVFCCYTGLRYGELARLQPEHIQQGEGYQYVRITQPKTKRSKSIVLSPKAAEILERYADKYTLCLPVISNQKYNSYLKDVAEAAKLTRPIRLVTFSGTRVLESTEPLHKVISSHTARHTCATLLLNGGADLKTVGNHLGHASVSSTEIYARLTEQEQHRRLLNIWGKSGAETPADPPVKKVKNKTKKRP